MTWSRRWLYPVLFLFALPLFLWMRWQPEQILLSALERPKIHKILSAGAIHKHWFPGLRVDAVKIRLRKGPPISLDYIDISPVWWRLILGTAAVKICGEGKHASFCLLVTLSGQKLNFPDIAVDTDFAALKPYLPQLSLFPVSGSIHMKGSLDLLWRSRKAGQANLHLDVKDAVLGSGKKLEPLGNYQLALLSQGPSWQWLVTGGGALVLEGKGTLTPSGVDVTKWPIRGQMSVTGKGEQSALWIKGLAGKSSAKGTVTGILRRPVLQWHH